MFSEQRSEQVSIYWNENATDGYDPEYDAKHFAANSNVHGIGVFDTDGNILSISALPELELTTQLPLNVFVPATNTFSFEVTGANTFGNGRCLLLIDDYTGASYPLTDGEILQMEIQAGTYSDRFYLGISNDVLGFTSDVTCYGLQNGEAVAQLTGQSNVFWYDESDQIIQQDLNVDEASARSLKPGFYSLEVQGIDGCPSVFATFQVQEPAQISATANTLDPTCPDSEDGFIEINSYGGVGLHTYLWNNGAEGPMLIELGPGEYAVEIKDEQGCAQEVVVALQAEENAEVDFSTDLEYYELEDGEATVHFYNQTESYDACTWDFGDGNTSSEFSPVHIYTAAGEYLVVLTITKGVCTFQTAAKVNVGSTVGINNTDLDLESGVDVTIAGSDLVITGYYAQPRALEIRVYNVIGQLLLPVEPIQIGNETVQLPLPERSQQIVVEILDTSLGERKSVHLAW